MKRLVGLVALMVVLSLLACSFSAGVGDGGAGLKTAVVCSDLAEDYGPVGPTDVFGPDDDFNISVEYSALEEAQTIGVKWLRGDELLYEQTVTMDAGNAGEGYAGFSLTNAEPWAAGDYHVDIYLDGEFDHTVNFRVTGAGVGDGGASLNTAVVCRDLADDYSPSGPTDVFGPDDELNVSIKYSDLEVDQTIGVKWFHGDEMIYEQTVTIDAAGAGDGDAGFTITNTELWATGDYHADIYLDGDFDHTAGFRVE